VRASVIGDVADVRADESRETITVIECVSADGTVLPPLLIYKGKNVQKRWRCKHALGAEAAFAASPNGWTDTELSL
jgi:hypothetical protein